VASVPDGTTIELVPGGRYRMERTLELRKRRNLTFDGNGATIFATTPGDRVRSSIAVVLGSDITFRDLTVKGANPNAGLAEAAYRPDKEAQNGFDILGTQRVTLTDVTVTDTYGDFVYLSKYNGLWSDGVHITNSHFERNGRQGITFVATRNALVENNFLNSMRRATFDFEPGRTDGWGVDNVTIRNNVIGSGRHFLVAAQGRGPVDNVTIEGNRVRGQALQVYVMDKDWGVRHNWRVLNNSSDLPFTTGNQAPMQFYKVNGVTVRGNRQPMKPLGIPMYGVRAENSCNLALGGNDYPNARGQSLVMGTC
jgi:polygalacturonase